MQLPVINTLFTCLKRTLQSYLTVNLSAFREQREWLFWTIYSDTIAQKRILFLPNGTARGYSLNRLEHSSLIARWSCSLHPKIMWSYSYTICSETFYFKIKRGFWAIIQFTMNIELASLFWFFCFWISCTFIIIIITIVDSI